MFHGLFEGNTWHPPTVGASELAGGVGVAVGVFVAVLVGVAVAPGVRRRSCGRVVAVARLVQVRAGAPRAEGLERDHAGARPRR